MSHDATYECGENECQDIDDFDAEDTSGEGFVDDAPAGEPHPELGECLASFRGDISRNLSWMGMLLMGLVVSAGMLAYIIRNEGLWPKEGLPIPHVVMAALVVTSITLLVIAFRNANSRLLLFDKGLMVLCGRRLTQFKWDDVEAVYEGMTVTTYEHGAATQIKHKLRFRLKDQRIEKINLSAYPDSEDVSGIVAAATTPRLLCEAQEKLAAGQPVDFGFIKMISTGLEAPGDWSGTKALGWRDVAEYTLADGYLTIKSIKGWATWAWKEVEDVPNLRVLVELLDQNTKNVLLPETEPDAMVPQLAGH